ncbi:hypothetical protein LTR84_010453 [Exophiala bonariae]|uniref:Bacteriophage T5 Orf172 DNA-binding domain-containing protein n=1 Tax=Exophiala bonariae TaxID=1690606 RepID=A0AAV9MTG3_9EURO|nr:hypothetical protein LTR84_010453 [Exophiala bonariae]
MTHSTASKAEGAISFSKLELAFESQMCLHPVWGPELKAFRTCKNSPSKALHWRQKALECCKDIIHNEDRDALPAALESLLSCWLCGMHRGLEATQDLSKAVIEKWKREVTADWKIPQEPCISISSSDDELPSVVVVADGRDAEILQRTHLGKPKAMLQVHEREVTTDEQQTATAAHVPAKAYPRWSTLENELFKEFGARAAKSGIVYVASCEDMPGLVKVGFSEKTAKQRLGGITQVCGISFKKNWESPRLSCGAYRLEQLILAQFRASRNTNQGRCPNEECRKIHGELLDSQFERVVKVAKQWVAWFEKGKPYENGMLNEYWRATLISMSKHGKMPTAKVLNKKLDSEASPGANQSSTIHAIDRFSLNHEAATRDPSAAMAANNASGITGSPSSDISTGRKSRESLSQILTDLEEDDTLVGEESTSLECTEKIPNYSASPILHVPGAFPKDLQEAIDMVKLKQNNCTRLQAKHGACEAKTLTLRSLSQSAS